MNLLKNINLFKINSNIKKKYFIRQVVLEDFASLLLRE